MQKKLFRSQANKKICGVCGGLGEYFDIDPTLIRLGWIVFSLMGGAGLLAYIIAALVIPVNTDMFYGAQDNGQWQQNSNQYRQPESGDEQNGGHTSV